MVTMTRELERGLIEAGVPEDQAGRVADALGEQFDQLATRQDVHHTEERLYQRINDVNDNLQRQMESMERTMWRIFLGLGTIMLAMFGAVFGALMYAVFGS